MAVAAEAQEIDFVVGTNDICVYFKGMKPEDAIHPERLPGVLNSQSALSPPADYLRLASKEWLNSGVWFRWALRTPRTFTVLEWDERAGEFELTVEDNTRGDLESVYWVQAYELGRDCIQGFGDRVYDLVAQRCSYSPLQLVGTVTRSGFWRRPLPAEWHSSLSEPYFLLEWFELETDGPLGLRTPSKELYRKDSRVWRRWSAPEPEGRGLILNFSGTGQAQWKPFTRCRRYASLPLALRGPDLVTFVKDGVALEDVVLCSSGSGMHIVVDADALKVDASGLRVVEDDRTRALLSQLVAWREQVWSLALEEISFVPAVAALQHLPEFVRSHLRKAIWPLHSRILAPVGLADKTWLTRAIQERLRELLSQARA